MTYTVEENVWAFQMALSGGPTVITGRAMTLFTCERCKKEKWWQNTNPPMFCTDCAVEIVKMIESETKGKTLSDLKAKDRRDVIQTALSGGSNQATFDVLTHYTCKKCHKEQVWGNSATPALCTNCANDLSNNLLKSYQFIDRYKGI